MSDLATTLLFAAGIGAGVYLLGTLVSPDASAAVRHMETAQRTANIERQGIPMARMTERGPPNTIRPTAYVIPGSNAIVGSEGMRGPNPIIGNYR